MARLTMTWQCGHTDSVRAKSRDQVYWERHAAQEVCQACWRAQRHQQAAEAAHTQGLVELTGTPAQVSWAETLRQEMLTKVEEIEATIPATDANLPTWRRLVQKLRIQSKAGWWIDQRGSTPLEIFRRWERARVEAEREKPISELLGHQAPPSSTQAMGFRPTSAPASTPVIERLQPAAVDDKPPVAGYRADGIRKIEVDDPHDAQEATT